VLTGVVFVLTVAASVFANRGRFLNPRRARFIFFKFHRLWNKMQCLSALKGVAQGYIITAPVMLIMKFVGTEGSVGIIQSAGAALSAMLLYFLGRKTNAGHRLKILVAGLSLFLLGSLLNSVFYSMLSVIIFIACLVFARPLLDLAYFPIQLKVIESVAAKEKRNQFAYIFSHEVGLFAGRIFGCSLFIALARYIDEDAALRYALPVIALVHFSSAFVARSIVKDPSWTEPVKKEMVALDTLKEPIEL
jgi:YQGE family putative transporter